MARPRSAWDIVFQFSRREGWQLLVSFLHIYSNLFPTCDFRSVDLVLPSDHSISSKGMNERFNEKDKIVIKGRENFLPCRGSIAGLARKPIYPLFWKILESCSSTSFVSITYAWLRATGPSLSTVFSTPVSLPTTPQLFDAVASTRRRRGSFISSRGPCNTFFFYGCTRGKEKSGGGWNLLVRDGARFLCEVHSWQKRRSI